MEQSRYKEYDSMKRFLIGSAFGAILIVLSGCDGGDLKEGMSRDAAKGFVPPPHLAAQNKDEYKEQMDKMAKGARAFAKGSPIKGAAPKR
jgi:hypothetical protein